MKSRDAWSGETPTLDASLSDHMSRWVELFYDLGFVAAILILSSAASHARASSVIGWAACVFAATWWVWFSTTLMANRFRMTDHIHRLLLLLQMLIVILMAMEARVSVTVDSRYLVLEYGALLLTLALIALRGVLRGSTHAGERWLIVGNAAAAACFFIAAGPGEPWRGLLAVTGLALSLGPTVAWVRRGVELTKEQEQHLTDRIGAFTLIVCGESFIEVAVSVSGAVLSNIDIVSMVFQFILVLALFTSYFEDIPAAGLDPRRVGPWAGGHLVALACIAATGVASAELVSLKGSKALPDNEILKLTLPLAVLYVALACIGACTRRRPILPLARARLVTAIAILGCGMLAWSVRSVVLDDALPILTAIAIAHAVVVVRLRDRTHLLEMAET